MQTSNLIPNIVLSLRQNKNMKNLSIIPAQTESKSILDMTPYELSQIDAYQNRNRGFEDEDEDLEDYYNED